MTIAAACLLLAGCATNRHGICNAETRRWSQGEPPVRVIREDEGFCALSMVTGEFNGAGESVRVWVGDDGWWYLGGSSNQKQVAAECVVVRY